MSDAIVPFRPQSLDETQSLSKTLAASALMPQALHKKPEDVLATILTGAELGLGPMQSIRGIQIIRGKPSLSADLMGALVKRHPEICEYLRLVESNEKRATYETKRRGEPEPTRLSFTIEEATRAGLSGGDNWRKYPSAMLRARALSAICRAVYPDLCLGLYDSDSGEIVDVTPDTPPTTQRAHVEEVKSRLAAELPATTPPDTEYTEFTPVDPEVEQLRVKIAGAKTDAELTALLKELTGLPEEKRKTLRGLYMDQKLKLQPKVEE